MNRGVLKECIEIFTLEINRIHLINRLKTISSGYFILNFFIWYILILFFLSSTPPWISESSYSPNFILFLPVSKKKNHSADLSDMKMCTKRTYWGRFTLHLCFLQFTWSYCCLLWENYHNLPTFSSYIFYISVAYKACAYLHLNLGSLTL